MKQHFTTLIQHRDAHQITMTQNKTNEHEP